MIPDLPSVISDVGPSKDIDLFYRSMSKVSLTLVASAAPSGVHSNQRSNFMSTVQNGCDYGTPQNSRYNLASSVPADYLSDRLSSKHTNGLVTRSQPSSLPQSSSIDKQYTTSSKMSSLPSSHLATMSHDISVLPVKHTDR